MPSSAGDVTFKISGKKIDKKCDPIESVSEAYDDDGNLAGYFHSSMPVSSGTFGVQLDVSNGGILQRPADPGFVLRLYNSRGPGDLIRGNQPAWYWSSPGEIWPDVGYSVGYVARTGGYPPQEVDTTLLCTPLTQDLGGGLSGGYVSVRYYSTSYTESGYGGISPNDWAFRTSLPCVVLTQDTAVANPGEPVYYTIACDLYPIIIHNSIQAYDYSYGWRTQNQTEFVDRVYLVGGKEDFGSDESYIINAQKHFAGQLVIEYDLPNGKTYRGPNPFTRFDGKLFATSPQITADALGPADPPIDDPAYTLSYDTGSIPPYIHDLTNRHQYEHAGINDVFGRPAYPPVPKTGDTWDVGDAEFDIQPYPEIFVFWTPYPQSLLGTSPVGATVELGVQFVDGSTYVIISGTVNEVYNTGDTKPFDYWMNKCGDSDGPTMPRPVGLYAVIDLPETVFSNGAICHAAHIDSRIPNADYTIQVGGPYNVSDPRTVGDVNGWSCNTKVQYTDYTVAVGGRGKADFAPPPSGSGQVTNDPSRTPENVYSLTLAHPTDTPQVQHSYTVNGGHTWAQYVVPTNGAGSYPSLIINPRTNAHRIIFQGDTDLFTLDAIQTPHVPSDWGNPVPLGLPYHSPFAVAHPAQGWDYILMSAVQKADDTTVDILMSSDGGLSWIVIAPSAGNVGKHLGRPALCWMHGGLVFLITPQGTTLEVQKSLDGGRTWGSATTALTSTVANGVTCPAATSHQGALYVAAYVSTSSTENTAMMAISTDLGATWSDPSNIPNYSTLGLGSNPYTGRLWLGNSHHSDTQGRSWTSD